MNKTINALGFLFLLGALVFFGILVFQIFTGVNITGKYGNKVTLAAMLHPILFTVVGLVLGIILQLLANLGLFGKDKVGMASNKGMLIIGICFLVISFLSFIVSIFKVIAGITIGVVIGQILTILVGIILGAVLCILPNQKIFLKS